MSAGSKRGISDIPVDSCDVGVKSKESLVSMSISVKLSGEECCIAGPSMGQSQRGR